MTVMLLFHGCNNQGYDWFRKPEEISFLREGLSHKISLVAFTTPRHRGNFCWPSEGSEFEEVRDLIGKALLELLQLKAESASASSASSSLILVGASSGGNFAQESQTTQRDPIESQEQVSHEAYENMKTEVTATSHVEQLADDKGFYMLLHQAFAELCSLDLSCHIMRLMFVHLMGSQVVAFLSVVSPTSFVRPRVLLRLLSSVQFWSRDGKIMP